MGGHGAGAAADFQAVHAGQHQVEYQRIPAALLELAQPLVAVVAMHDLEALVAQVQTLATRLGGAACVFEEETGVDAPNLLAGGCGCGECTCG